MVTAIERAWAIRLLEATPKRPSERLSDLADEVAEKVLLWAKRILSNKRASKADRERAIQMVVPMVSRRVTAREEEVQFDAQVALEAEIEEMRGVFLALWEAQTNADTRYN